MRLLGDRLMMASFLRVAPVAVLISSAMGFAIVAMPSQTTGAGALVQGMGQPLLPAPTDAPSMELVKARMQKRAVTNICTEWTIPGGFGQPECSNSETCLFTSASGYYYEGCGQTSIAYDWVTECWNYPQSGLPPVSEIYCPASAPYCGWFAFVLGVDYTFYNFGCSTVSYGLFVDLLPTTTGGSSATVVLNGGGTNSITDVASTIYVTASSGASAGQTSIPNLSTPITSTVTEGGSTSSSTSTSNPVIGSHSSPTTPTGAIAGGVIGGIAVIAFVAFLIWFVLRKKRQDAAKAAEQQAQTQQQQADAAAATAFANSQRISEIGGTNVKPFLGAYAPIPGPEKQSAISNTNEMYTPTQPEQPQHQSIYGDNLHAVSQSPPPVYPQHSPQTPYNENPRPVSVAPPVSPLGTVGSQSPPPNVAEMYQQPYQQQYQQPVQPQHQQQYQQQPPPTELGGENRGSWQVPQGYQEMAVPAPQNVPRPPQGPPPGHYPTPQPTPVPQSISEMGVGASTGPRPPQGPPPPHVVNPDIPEMSATNTGPRLPPGPPPGHGGDGFDMSGAPMSEDLGHYELE